MQDSPVDLTTAAALHDDTAPQADPGKSLKALGLIVRCAS